MSEKEYSQILRTLLHREISPEDYELLLRLDETLPKRNVLSAEAVSAATRTRQGRVEDGDCAICTCPLVDGVVSVLCCDHTFHDECIRNWLTTGRNSCPMCGTAQCGECDE